MTSIGEVDPNQIPFHWHWLMYSLLDFFGPAVVWSIGIEALEYPPTWVDTQQEADDVEAALVRYAQGQTNG